MLMDYRQQLKKYWSWQESKNKKKGLPNKPKKEITPIRVCSDRGEIVKKKLIDNLFYVKT